MNGVRPTSRTASAYGVLLLTAMEAVACTHAPARRTTAATSTTPLVEVDPQATRIAQLEVQLGERDQTIVRLENQLALIQASERDLRERLEQADARLDEPPAPAPREAVRRAGKAETKAESRVVLGNQSNPRPVLRLHNDARGGERSALTSSWTPPVATERLTVAAVPDLPLATSRSLKPEAPPPAAKPVMKTNAEADELYLHALDLLRRRELPEALRELDAFLRGYPTDPRNGRAQYFRGEILYAQRDYARALSAYEQSLVRDPQGDKAPDTLLRIARCQTQLGAHERARAALNKLKTQFPDSEAARVAAQRKQEDT